MGAEPKPASVAKRQRLEPSLMAITMVEPKRPPVTDENEKACSKIRQTAWPMNEKLTTSKMPHPSRYMNAMVGTSAEHARDMPLSPKSSTPATNKASTPPVTTGGTVDARVWATVLACTKLPIPMAAMVVKTAKSTANHLQLRPRSMAYMGPPLILPSLSCTR